MFIHIDDHIVERDKRYYTGNDEWYEYYQLQWDTEYLKENLFKKLHQNVNQLVLPFYNKKENKSTFHMINVPSNCMVIIEGIFLLRQEWKFFYDYVIFLECPRDVRYERVLQRDTYLGSIDERLKKYEKRYWIAEDYYIKTQNPKGEATKVYHSF